MSIRSPRGRRAAAHTRATVARPVASRAARALGALHAHPHRTAAGLLGLLVFAYLWPALVGGKALAATSLLYGLSPWAAFAPPGIAHTTNFELGDVVALYFPWDVLGRHLLHAGTFPAWNPYALGGVPLFANFQIAWLSPFSLPLWTLPLNYAFGVAAALKLWLAGFGTYLLVRELRLGFWPGIVAGASFALCAFNVVWLSHGVFVSVASMLPWGCWLAERLVRRARPLDGLALVGVVAVIQTGGHPGTQLHVLSGIVLFAVLRACTTTQRRMGERLEALGLLAGAVVVGTMLAAVVMLPAQLADAGSTGVLARRNGAALFAGSSMPWHVIRTALFPDWWGRASEQLAAAGPANYRERNFYAGAATLVLALIGLLAAGGWRRKGPLALIAVLGAAIAVRTPLHALVVHLPLFDQVQDQRILLWWAFAVSVLGAFGVQALQDRGAAGRAWAVVGAASLVGLAALLSVGVDSHVLAQGFRHFLDRAHGGTAKAEAAAAAAWWLVFVLALAVLLALAGRRRTARRLLGPLLALVVALDMLHFAHGYQKMIPASSVVPPAPPAIAYLQRHVGDGRITAVGEAVFDDIATVYGLRDARGRDVPWPTTRFGALWGTMGDTIEAGTILGVTANTAKVLGVLGVRYLLVPLEARFHARGFAPVYRGRDALVYADTLALPRASVMPRVQPVGELGEELAAVASESFDARQVGVVRGDQISGAPPSAETSGTARVVAERNAEVDMRATLRDRGLVVLDDSWMPGWSVEVDGRPEQTVLTDVVLRGVIVPAGTHRIVWRYRIPGLRAGAAISAAGLVLVALWSGWLALRARRARLRRLGR